MEPLSVLCTLLPTATLRSMEGLPDGIRAKFSEGQHTTKDIITTPVCSMAFGVALKWH